MPANLDVVIAMPAFNEEASMSGFLREIAEAFADTTFQLVVVNDCSTDGTEGVVRDLVNSGLPITIHSNETNSGHGPSTVTALSLAVSLGPRYVVATDGDGHIAGGTLRDLYARAEAEQNPTIVEGIRAKRDDPWFRKLVSLATRFLVKLKSGVGPADANTPFRVYPLQELRDLLDHIPPDHLTPNLMMSTLVRQKNIIHVEEGIVPIQREGASENGSTWKQKFRVLPSRRFLRFCRDAITQWVKPRKVTNP